VVAATTAEMMVDAREHPISWKALFELACKMDEVSAPVPVSIFGDWEEGSAEVGISTLLPDRLLCIAAH
jgi:hypothetical protein